MRKKKEVKLCYFKDSNIKEGTNQKSDVIACDLCKAHELFNKEYFKKKQGISEWDYFDITVNGKLLRSSNM